MLNKINWLKLTHLESKAIFWQKQIDSLKWFEKPKIEISSETQTFQIKGGQVNFALNILENSQNEPEINQKPSL